MAERPFRLARVLRLRTQLRERAQEDVARESAALAEAQTALVEVRAAADAARAAEADAAAGGMTGAELHRSRAWTDTLANREQTLTRETSRLTTLLEQLRSVLLARRRGERQLEILRERANERGEAEDARTTATLLDDLARRKRP